MFDNVRRCSSNLLRVKKTLAIKQTTLNAIEFREKSFQTSFLKQNFNMSQKARTTYFKVTGK